MGVDAVAPLTPLLHTARTASEKQISELTVQLSTSEAELGRQRADVARLEGEAKSAAAREARPTPRLRPPSLPTPVLPSARRRRLRTNTYQPSRARLITRPFLPLPPSTRRLYCARTWRSEARSSAVCPPLSSPPHAPCCPNTANT